MKRCLFAAAVAGALALVGPAAYADVVYNDLDNTIDTTHESMALTYNTDTLTGSTGTTTLAIQIQGLPGNDPSDTDPTDHSGCNIQGGSHYIALSPEFTTPGIVDVSLSNDGVFNTCQDTVTATVTALMPGSTTVSFVIDESRTNNDPSLTFDLRQATFDVTVTAVTGGGGTTVCDADPAAPAWAAAMLQKTGVKPGSKLWNNYISQVADHMTTGAMFEGWYKNEPEYPGAVHDWMVTALGLTGLASPESSARPGWVCTTQ